MKSEAPSSVKRILSTRSVEFLVWAVIAFVASARFWADWWWYSLRGPDSLGVILAERYFDLVSGVGIILFPVLVSQIFGHYPFEYLRLVRSRRDENISGIEPKIDEAQDRQNRILTGLEPESGEELLKNLAYSSRKISENIYTRAGVYLLIGVLIAFSGLIFFYIQTGKLSDIRDVTNLLLNLAPRFGILFFIEVIAFFFLRQYRIAMDEFRYFEAIKRNREETLALIRLAQQGIDGLSVQEVLNKCSFYSNAGKLAAGESTELLESKKLDKNELELVDKLLDVLGRTTQTK